MNLGKKLYCRIFQQAFWIALPFLPYRNPKLRQSLSQIPDILKEEKKRKPLVVTDQNLVKVGAVKPLLDILDTAGVKYALFDKAFPNPTTQLVERCREDKAAISRCLNQLMERGLVVRQTPENQRAYRCRHYLTPEGARLVEKMNDRIQAALSTGGNGLTPEQRETFYQAMDLIRENLAGYLKEKEKERKEKERAYKKKLKEREKARKEALKAKEKEARERAKNR